MFDKEIIGQVYCNCYLPTVTCSYGSYIHGTHVKYAVDLQWEISIKVNDDMRTNNKNMNIIVNVFTMTKKQKRNNSNMCLYPTHGPALTNCEIQVLHGMKIKVFELCNNLLEISTYSWYQYNKE